MTPGFAKPRSELPWLPYAESDRVIINSHNFTPIWTPSVNGKMPIAAWVPSRDTAGNGTTTLTDLIGSRNMTLTNFALTGSTSNWVADTDAGGIRCLDFDGTNDYCVTANDTARTITAYSISAWIKRSASQRSYIAGPRNAVGEAPSFSLELYQTVSYLNLPVSGVYAEVPFTASGAWNHYVLSYDGSQAGNSNRLKHWIDGSQKTLTFTGTVASSYVITDTPSYLGFRPWAASYAPGRKDDIRFFDVGLDASDVSYLYAGGSGRGV